MNERDKALLEAIEAVQVMELEHRVDFFYMPNTEWDRGFRYGFKEAARIIAELRKEEA